MVKIDMSGLEETKVALDPAKVPSFTRNVNNDMAFKVRFDLMQSIKRIFPDARPETARNIFVKKATRENQTAVVLFDQIYRRGLDEYMVPNVEGGKRAMKPSEKRLNTFYVPGAGAKLDQYGNMRGGQVTQILSRLQMFNTAGYDMNETAASRRRREGKSKTTEYFIIRQQRGGLKPGVYQRVQTAAGFGAKTVRSMQAGQFQKGKTVGKFSSVIRARGVVPVMVFTKSAPGYKARWPFFAIAHGTVKRELANVVAKNLEQMLRVKQ